MLVQLTFRGGGGGAVQNRESPDFRSPEVGKYVNRPFTFNHLLKSWYRLSCEVQYKHFGAVLQMDLNRVKFGL